MTALAHVPVMMEEVLADLSLRPGQVAVDGTLGMAGHAKEMAGRISPGGLLIGLDWDAESLSKAGANLASVSGASVETFHADYRALRDCVLEACQKHGRRPQADGILLDMGLSNVHLEDESRGFSFRAEAPLDMRMDRSAARTAAALLSQASPQEIEDILWVYGDERWARRIAAVIVERRKTAPLKTTSDLVDCVLAAIPAAKRDKRIHPATRTFQAVRIAVNGELDGLESAVESAAQCLAKNGVLCVLAYHSGEDRVVKTVFRALSKTGAFEELHRKPLVPSPEEISANPKSRSAKLRSLRRLEDPS